MDQNIEIYCWQDCFREWVCGLQPESGFQIFHPKPKLLHIPEGINGSVQQTLTMLSSALWSWSHEGTERTQACYQKESSENQKARSSAGAKQQAFSYISESQDSVAVRGRQWVKAGTLGIPGSSLLNALERGEVSSSCTDGNTRKWNIV